jgi:hypothetical protein
MQIRDKINSLAKRTPDEVQERERRDRARQERLRRDEEMEIRRLEKTERKERRTFLSQVVSTTKEHSKHTLATYNKVISSEERPTKSIIPNSLSTCLLFFSNLNHN